MGWTCPFKVVAVIPVNALPSIAIGPVNAPALIVPFTPSINTVSSHLLQRGPFEDFL